MSEHMSEKTIDFIREMLPVQDNELLKRIEAECEKEFIPLVKPETGRFLQVLVNLQKPRRILEIGTGFGYSTILLASACQGRKASLTTIEIDEDRFNRACQNFRTAGVAGMISPLCGDAGVLLPKLEDKYDFIFLDAAKGQYPEFFAKLWPLLEQGGTLVIDNVFLGGWVIDMYWPERRKKTMVCRVRELLETLKNHPDLITSLIPLGDGLALSVRR